MVQQAELDPASIDIITMLAKKRDAEQRAEAEYHVHPPDQEGASGLGGCTAIRAMKEAGIPVPKPAGAKADWGAAYVGNSTHAKYQRDLVPLLQQQFPDARVGPIIDADGHVHEVVIETDLITGKKILSPLDLCLATKPGFVLKTVQYRNKPKDVYMLAPGAKFLAAWDIKSANAFAFWKHQTEGLGRVYTAQGLAYLKATGLKVLPFLFVNKINYHEFFLDLTWADDAWAGVQAKRQREIVLAKQLKETGNADFVDDDFFYITEDAEFYCAYCPLSETHEEESFGSTRIILDKPCPAAAALVEAGYAAKFTPGSRWQRGAAMITVQSVKDGNVLSIAKGDLEKHLKARHGRIDFKTMWDNVTMDDVASCTASYTDTIFHAGKIFVQGWEKKEKPAPAARPPVVGLRFASPVVAADKPAAHRGTIGLGVDAADGVPVKQQVPCVPACNHDGRSGITIITRAGKPAGGAST